MIGKLLVKTGPGSGREEVLSSEVVVIGRSNASHIALDDAQVSRQHAEFKQQAGRWYVHDLGSANGTFVNERRLSPTDIVALHPGDRLRLGQNIELSFEIVHEPVSAVPSFAQTYGEESPPHPLPMPLLIGMIAVVMLVAAAAFWIWRSLPGSKNAAVETTTANGSQPTVGDTMPQVVEATLPAVVPNVVPTALPPVSGLPTVVLPTVIVPAGAAPAQAQPAVASDMGASAQPEQLSALIAQAFPGSTLEQMPAAVQQAVQSGQVKPETVQQVIGELFPGVPPAQLGSAFVGSFAGFTPPQIEQILNVIYPGQNLELPEIPTGEGAIAFTVWEGDKPSIYLMNADGSDKQMLIEQASEPAFSPDGKRLAYYSWRDDALGLRIRDMDSGKDVQLTGGQDDYYPTWSPDGNRLVFWQWPSDIAIINADGSDRRGICKGQFPAWSPRGDHIAIKGCVVNDCGIVLINPDGSSPVRITTNANDGQPAWSPDGQNIAFVSNRDGNWEIYAVRADGSWLRRITDDPHTDGLPAWASDGMRIAFRSDRSGIWAIYTATGVGGSPIKLVDAPVRGTDAYPWDVEKISWR